MSDMNIIVQFEVNKGNLVDSQQRMFQPSKSDESFDGPVLTIGTTEEDVVFVGDLTLPAIVVMQNLGATDVRYGPKSGGAMIPWGRIGPLECYPFRLDSGTVVIRMLSVTAANKVRFWAFGGV